MMGTPIRELEVQSMDARLYKAFRTYLEQHHCIWQERWDADHVLQGIHLLFPDGTASKPFNHPGWCQIDFPDGGFIYWMIDGKRNHMTMPDTSFSSL